MSDIVLTDNDLALLAQIGKSPEQLSAEIEFFKTGFPFVELDRPCTIGDGITVLSDSTHDALIKKADDAAAAGRVKKFVPASGAATRMFKSLMAVHYDRMLQQNTSHPDTRFLKTFFDRLTQFAFYDELDGVLAKDGLSLETLRQTRSYSDVLSYLMHDVGLDYAHRPKALIPFHRYPEGARTALEEHLTEALAYATDTDQNAYVHFTISSEYRQLIDSHIQTVRSRYETSGRRIQIEISEQKPSTDTLAVDLHNRPVRDQDGRLHLRPAGHGALIENLNDLAGDIVFIKNIDNVVPDRLKEPTFRYKKILCGHLIEMQLEIFGYLKKLKNNPPNSDTVTEAESFAISRLGMQASSTMDIRERRDNLMQFLNRPIRVCGMVRNQGEPGGGPFWVREPNGNRSLQIVETAQIDLQWPKQKLILDDSTHFNPVDIVCGVRDFEGKPFDLHRFIDPHTGFISKKSKDGREIKAMELPGLWNGAMAKWITIFAEVPLITFNPVKTINDLLRPEHQP
ncbi:MAG TPA: DUF4301 family protein [bacterium]|nr:DUF4301 family protein [bacterium]HMW37324.1 DUF4301 family protein [bacterium]HMY35491.1 DUF4301 family protein [bacterium]HMZ05692.1 DUF4301 family protein [bacterium]HNB08760.1 DUF4301 family protein [bacterium]